MVSTDLQTHMVSLSEMQNNSLKTEPIREDTSGMSHKLKVQYWPIDEVHPYPNNPRNNDDAVEYVANSIREFGWQQPIVVDTDGTIIAGHTRLKAAKLLGMETVPVVVADNLTPAQVNAYRLADNKVAEAATWDMEALAVELEGLEVDFDMTMFDFDASEFDFGGLGGEPTEIVEDEVPEDAPSIVQKGDVWQLGRHRLMCGDSTDSDSVALLMDGNRADVCFTSPPYNMGRSKVTNVPSKTMNGGMAYGLYEDDLTDGEYADLLCDSLENALAHCDDALYNIGILSGSKQGIITLLDRFRKRFCDIIVWKKDSAIPLGFDAQYGQLSHVCELVFCFNKKGIRNFTHPQWKKNAREYNVIETENNMGNEHAQNRAAFPVAFASDVITRFTDTSVLDLFGGTGTTLIAAEQLGRICYMMELDPSYCDIIIERWQNLTGETARKVESDG